MKGRSTSRAAANNHANQMNSNNSAYWGSRGVAPPAVPSASNSAAGARTGETEPKEAITPPPADSTNK